MHPVGRDAPDLSETERVEPKKNCDHTFGSSAERPPTD